MAKIPYGMNIENSQIGSGSKTFGKFLKVCTNSVSVMNEAHGENRFRSLSKNKSRVVVIVENEDKDEEEKLEVTILRTKINKNSLTNERDSKILKDNFKM